MKVEGSYMFNTDRETLWTAMLSPEVFSGCIPGCQQFQPTSDDSYDVELKVGVASITGTYAGRVTVVERNHPEHYRMLIEGTGSGGSIKGSAQFAFTENDRTTEIRVVGDAQVTGMVARVGQRLMGSASRMLMNQFFACLKDKIEA